MSGKLKKNTVKCLEQVVIKITLFYKSRFFLQFWKKTFWLETKVWTFCMTKYIVVCNSRHWSKYSFVLQTLYHFCDINSPVSQYLMLVLQAKLSSELTCRSTVFRFHSSVSSLIFQKAACLGVFISVLVSLFLLGIYFYISFFSFL